MEIEAKKRLIRRIYVVLYYITVIVIMTYVMLIAIREQRQDSTYLTDFSKGWTAADGSTVDLVKENYGHKTVQKYLPDVIKPEDTLCFESNNANVTIWIGENVAYDFRTEENFTGRGYGYTFHYISLPPSDSGKKMTISYKGSVPGDEDMRIMDLYIAPVSNYFHHKASQMMVPCALSIMILFFGILLLFIQLSVGIDNVLPFSVSSLAAISIVMGIWGIADSNIIQLVTGRIYTARFLYMILPFLVTYPIICFVNSLTHNKRLMFRNIAFVISTVFIVLVPFIRFILGIDLSYVFFKMAATEIFLLVVLIVVIIVDDANYCKKHGIEMGIKSVVPGILILGICSCLDIFSYVLGKQLTDNNSLFLRFGMLLFIFILMGQFFKWWTKDKKSVEVDRFINRALQFAVSSNSPDESIRSMIAFLGKEFGAKRLFVFEDQKNGKYRGTYEWFREGEESASLELMYLPYDNLVDRLYTEFNNNDHRLIIENVDYYRDSIPALYNVIKTNHIDNMILAPLEVGGNIFGVCGAINTPLKDISVQAEVINLISYFIAQLILQREEQDRSYFYNYNDVLSGAGNYMAYRKFVEEELDISSPFGYLRCDLFGLDEINVAQGYEVGDQIVVLASHNLMEIFGEKAVFRMNGTQFAAFGFETDEQFFNNDVERLKKLMKENGIEAAIASVYCIYGTKDMNLVTKRVDELMFNNRTGEE